MDRLLNLSVHGLTVKSRDGILGRVKARALGGPGVQSQVWGSCPGAASVWPRTRRDCVFELRLKCFAFCSSEVAVLWGNIRNQQQFRLVSSYQQVGSL